MGELLRKGPRIDTDELTFEETVLREPEGLARLERQLIENTLRRFKDNKDRTARALGLSRASLYRRLKAWGLAEEDEEAD